MEQRAPRAAIIMPAYNAEKTIERTVRSILDQTVGDLLLLAVNDGSTDETAAILERLHEEDARVCPITVENGGPARARNLALDLVPPGTEYLMFSDADDLLASDALEYAIENAGDADLVLMGFSILNPDGSEARYSEPAACYTPDTLGPALGRLYKANLLNQVWGKLFRAGLVLDNRLRFPDYRWGEDRLFIYSDRRMEALCERFGVTDRRDHRYMFVKSIFSCLTTLFSPHCTLTREEKRAEIRRAITNEHVQERSRDVFGGAPVQALCAVMHTKNVTLNYLAFRSVARAGQLAPRLFTAIKHRK